MAELREKIKVIGVVQMRLHIQALNDDLSGWDDYVRSVKDIGPIKYWVSTGNTCVPLDTIDTQINFSKNQRRCLSGIFVS